LILNKWFLDGSLNWLIYTINQETNPLRVPNMGTAKFISVLYCLQFHTCT